jgi:hypothetical protein
MHKFVYVVFYATMGFLQISIFLFVSGPEVYGRYVIVTIPALFLSAVLVQSINIKCQTQLNEGVNIESILGNIIFNSMIGLFLLAIYVSRDIATDYVQLYPIIMFGLMAVNLDFYFVNNGDFRFLIYRTIFSRIPVLALFLYGVTAEVGILALIMTSFAQLTISFLLTVLKLRSVKIRKVISAVEFNKRDAVFFSMAIVGQVYSTVDVYYLKDLLLEAEIGVLNFIRLLVGSALMIPGMIYQSNLRNVDVKMRIMPQLLKFWRIYICMKVILAIIFYIFVGYFVRIMSGYEMSSSGAAFVTFSLITSSFLIYIDQHILIPRKYEAITLRSNIVSSCIYFGLTVTVKPSEIQHVFALLAIANSVSITYMIIYAMVREAKKTPSSQYN